MLIIADQYRFNDFKWFLTDFGQNYFQNDYEAIQGRGGGANFYGGSVEDLTLSSVMYKLMREAKESQCTQCLHNAINGMK